MNGECRHVEQVDLHKAANTNGCEECLKAGETAGFTFGCASAAGM